MRRQGQDEGKQKISISIEQNGLAATAQCECAPPALAAFEIGAKVKLDATIPAPVRFQHDDNFGLSKTHRPHQKYGAILSAVRR
jgi:hypothetical protein